MALIADFNDDFLEFLLADEAAFGIDSEGEVGGIGKRRSAHGTGGDLGVLLLDGGDDVSGGNVAGGGFLWVQPDAHGIIAGAENGDLADAWEAGEDVLYLEGSVVADEDIVILFAGGDQVHDQSQVGGGFQHADANATDLFGQAGEGLVDAVLDLDLGFVEISAQLEGDSEAHRTIGRGLGRHVEAVFHPIDGFFQGRGDGGADHVRTGPGVNRDDLHGGRHDFRVFANRKRAQGDSADDRDEHGEHAGEDGARDEVLAEVHGKAVRGQRSGGRGQGAAVRGQRSESSGQRAAGLGMLFSDC